MVPTQGPNSRQIYDNSSQKQRELKVCPFWADGLVHRLLVEAMKPVLSAGCTHTAARPFRGGAAQGYASTLLTP